jgi:hypothetical protein
MGGVDITDYTATTFKVLVATNATSIATGALQSAGGLGVALDTFLGGLLNIADAKDIVIAATTGSKIGQAGSKIGIYGKTPVVQPAVPTFAATTTVAVAGAVYTAVEQAMLGTLKADVIALRASIVALCNRFDQSAAAVGILSGTGA